VKVISPSTLAGDEGVNVTATLHFAFEARLEVQVVPVPATA
jgi:hypothetical protein